MIYASDPWKPSLARPTPHLCTKGRKHDSRFLMAALLCQVPCFQFARNRRASKIPECQGCCILAGKVQRPPANVLVLGEEPVLVNL